MKKEFRVDHLVLLSFVGPRPLGTECIHFPDTSLLNCEAANLQWGLPSANPHRIHAHQLQPRICEWCDREFLKKGRSLEKWEKVRFCSAHCRQAARKAHDPLAIEIPDFHTLNHLYIDRRLTTREIAGTYNVNRVTVARWLRHHGIRLREANCGLVNRGVEPPDRETLVRLVYVEHLSYEGIAKLYGVNFSAIRHWLIKHDIPRPTPLYTRLKGILPELPDDETLRNLYESGGTLTAIGESYGVSLIVIRRLCREYGIKVRPGGFNRIGGMRYVTDDGNEVRSSYEKKVADWLYAHGIEYVYEPTVPFSTTHRSDFIANGWYIEIWGIVGSDTYNERRRLKTAAYKASRLPLIELSAHHFTAAYAKTLEKRLSLCLDDASRLALFPHSTIAREVLK